jgi:hypothetical protein
VNWRTGQVFNSSWQNNTPFTTIIGGGQVIKGWDTGLVGQTVGSRVLLVVPPADGYGSAGQPQAGIDSTDTLVFVVDILAATWGRTSATVLAILAAVRRSRHRRRPLPRSGLGDRFVYCRLIEFATH